MALVLAHYFVLFRSATTPAQQKLGVPETYAEYVMRSVNTPPKGLALALAKSNLVAVQAKDVEPLLKVNAEFLDRFFDLENGQNLGKPSKEARIAVPLLVQRACDCL